MPSCYAPESTVDAPRARQNSATSLGGRCLEYSTESSRGELMGKCKNDARAKENLLKMAETERERPLGEQTQPILPG